MSNSLAIASVTATLQNLLTYALNNATDILNSGPHKLAVSTVRPTSQTQGLTKKGVNLYLCRITPNAALRNDDIPTRGPGGRLMQRPSAAIDLHYLLSFHGDEQYWEPQRILGITLQTLHAYPVLSRELVKQIVDSVGSNTDFDFMKKSNLAESIDQVRLTLESLELEELSKLWSIMLQTPYELSILYRASVVVVDAELPIAPVLPVRRVETRALPFSAPFVERVTNVEADEPIMSTSPLVIHGKRLHGDLTRLLIDGSPLTATLDLISDTQIRMDLGTLAEPLSAGVHGLQVAHMLLLGEPPSPHMGTESNVAAFVVHPQLTNVTKTNITTTMENGEQFCEGQISLTFNPQIGRSQRAILLLYRLTPDTPARSYAFEAAPRPSGVGDPLSTAIIDFDIKGMSPGTYAVRARIDGAESAPLAASEAYPQVTLP